MSEYMRALSLKQNGNPDFALGLFEDLLRTQVLSDVSVRFRKAGSIIMVNYILGSG